MKKLLSTILVALSCATVYAENTKQVFNPFTGKPDYITSVNNQNFQSGSGVTVTCTNGSCVFTGGGGGASSLQVTQGGVQITSPTASINFSSNSFSLTSIGGSTATISLQRISLSTGIAGILPVSNGGTGSNLTGAANGLILIGNGTTLGSTQINSGTDCSSSNNALTWNSSLDNIGCNTISGGIVSPGTFTWTNNFGVSLSTLSLSGPMTSTFSGSGSHVILQDTNAGLNESDIEFDDGPSSTKSALFGWNNTIAQGFSFKDGNNGLLADIPTSGSTRGTMNLFFGLSATTATFSNYLTVPNEGIGVSTDATIAVNILSPATPTNYGIVSQTGAGTGNSTAGQFLASNPAASVNTGIFVNASNGLTNDAIVISGGDIKTNSSAGSSGQALTSNGSGSMASWKTIPLLASTQTWTGGNTFYSSTTFNGNVLISSGLIANGSAGSSGQVLTSGGAGTVPTWTTVSSGGGSSALQVTNNGVQITSPTASMNFSPNFTLAAVSSTSTIDMSALQTTITTIASSLTVTGAGGIASSFGVTASSLSLTGTGNATITQNGLTGQVVISTAGTGITFGHCAEFSSSMSIVDAGAACGSGSGGTPGGSSTQVQYNSGGSFAGIPGSVVGTSSITFGALSVSTSNVSTVNPGDFLLSVSSSLSASATAYTLDTFGNSVQTGSMTVVSAFLGNATSTSFGNNPYTTINSSGTSQNMAINANGFPSNGTQNQVGAVTISGPNFPNDSGFSPELLVLRDSTTNNTNGAGMLELWEDNPSHNSYLLWIHGSSTRNSDEPVRFDGPTWGIDEVNTSTDNTHGLGKWKVINSGFQQTNLNLFNSRSWDNTTFEPFGYVVPLTQSYLQAPGLWLNTQSLTNDSGILTSSDTTVFGWNTLNNHVVGLTGPQNPSASWNFRLPSTFNNQGQVIYQASNGDGNNINARRWEFTTGGTNGYPLTYTGGAPTWTNVIGSSIEIVASTTSANIVSFSTVTSGGFVGVNISTRSTFNVVSSSITSGISITNGTGDANCSNTACTITATGSPVTFNFTPRAYTNVPVCTVSEQTMSVVNALTYSKTASALTITQTGLSGNLVDVICVGRDK